MCSSDLAVAGALVGAAGAVHVLGTEHRLTEGVAGNIGFDAITVALLGRSGPLGIVLAGLLFAGLSTGGRFMESSQGVPLDLVQVIQVLVVLFIAAPPLVRTLIGLRRIDHPGAAARVRRARRARTGAAQTTAPTTAAQAAATAPSAARTAEQDETIPGMAQGAAGAHTAGSPAGPDAAEPPGGPDPAPPEPAAGAAGEPGPAPSDERPGDRTDAQEEER